MSRSLVYDDVDSNDMDLRIRNSLQQPLNKSNMDIRTSLRSFERDGKKSPLGLVKPTPSTAFHSELKPRKKTTTQQNDATLID